MNTEQLKANGWVETSPGFWHKGNQLHVTDKTCLIRGITPTGEKIAIELPRKRIRQSTKPLMNKLEQEWFDHLCRSHRKLIAQGITFRLANGLRFTPDVFCFEWPD